AAGVGPDLLARRGAGDLRVVAGVDGGVAHLARDRALVQADDRRLGLLVVPAVAVAPPPILPPDDHARLDALAGDAEVLQQHRARRQLEVPRVPVGAPGPQ